MTSIQQSMNQMLGAIAGVATAGSYMARQTPGFKRKEELSHLAKQAKDLEVGEEELSTQAGYETYEEGQKGNLVEVDKTSAWKRMKEVSEKRLRVAQREFELDPTEKRAEHLRKLQQDFEENFPADAKQQAEDNAMERLETRSMTAREMLSALQQRKDLLSAKERGQIGTMAGRHKDKGGMDE